MAPKRVEALFSPTSPANRAVGGVGVGSIPPPTTRSDFIHRLSLSLSLSIDIAADDIFEFLLYQVERVCERGMNMM